MSDVKIAMPNYLDVIRCWHEIEPFIQKAVDESNGELTTDSIKEKVANKEVIVLTIYDLSIAKLIAVTTFDMVTFESGIRVLNIQCAGGERVDEWFAEVDAIANCVAKRHDCSKIYVIGRNGWARKLKPIGYAPVHTVISREVV